MPHSLFIGHRHVDSTLAGILTNFIRSRSGGRSGVADRMSQRRILESGEARDGGRRSSTEPKGAPAIPGAVIVRGLP
jgi:hypothetical protein